MSTYILYPTPNWNQPYTVPVGRITFGFTIVSGDATAAPDVIARSFTIPQVSVSVAACGYGTARTWPTGATCFARWSYNG